jgi:hypothetical protein
MTKDDSPKLDPRHTQRAAEGAVQAELNRRRISTAPTLANEPSLDLIAIHGDGRFTPIEVKGQQNRNTDWFVKRPRREDTIYFFVFVPRDELQTVGKYEFFIMTAPEVRAAMDKYLEDRRARGTSDEKWQDAIRWPDTLPHKDYWHKLDKDSNSLHVAA